jgi:ketosteroid isomerase-like protein
MHADQPTQQAVLRVQEQFWQALRSRDAALMAAVLAPEFVGRSPGEADQTREEFVATLTAFPVRIADIDGEALAIHVFDAVAILTGVQVARLELPDGTARSSRVMLTNVFCQRGLNWRMVLSHAFELVQDL